MPAVCYKEHRFSASVHAMIGQANAIIAEYAAQGYDLTLRQLYYQFVSRDLLANTQKEYKRLGAIINDARLAGMVDWDHITDRTRHLASNSHWKDAADIVGTCASSFALDKWARQDCRVEVWIEKEALAGVFQGVCEELDVPYFCCRGYTSQSEMWSAAQRLFRHMQAGQWPHILHFGDHDPSGLDMTRDIEERLTLFIEQDWVNKVMRPGHGVEVRVKDIRDSMEKKCGGRRIIVKRIALNMDQIQEYNPPANPAKMSDSRADGYVAEHGDESWELDALDPATLVALVREEVEALRDNDLWEMASAAEERHRETLTAAAQRWPDVQSFLAE